jgi:hypothetical protein
MSTITTTMFWATHRALANNRRKLIEASYGSSTRLDAYRGDTLCLRVRSVGEGRAVEDGHGSERLSDFGSGRCVGRRPTDPFSVEAARAVAGRGQVVLRTPTPR